MKFIIHVDDPANLIIGARAAKRMASTPDQTVMGLTYGHDDEPPIFAASCRRNKSSISVWVEAIAPQGRGEGV